MAIIQTIRFITFRSLKIKDISTLVPDLENLLLNGTNDITEEQIEKFAKQVAETIREKLKLREKEDFTLRMSNIGTPCVRKPWLDKNHPEGKEEFTPATKFKFLIGDLGEELLLFLAEVSGHEVTGRQTELSLAGIKGHRDALIDGTLVDAKSASSFSFEKFQEGLTPEKDAFGYLSQLGGYHKAGLDDPEMTNKESAAFLVFDKQHGHIHLDIHKYNHDEILWEQAYEERKKIVNGPDLPERHYKEKDDGYKNPKTKEFIPNGNKLLDTNCSYCAQKFNCWENIRTFISSSGPKYFTKIVKEPKMKEITQVVLDANT